MSSSVVAASHCWSEWTTAMNWAVVVNSAKPRLMLPP